MLYFREPIQPYEIHIEADADIMETCWCSLKTQGSKITMGVAYRCPPISKDEDTRLHKVITHVSRGECLLIGIFYQPDIR